MQGARATTAAEVLEDAIARGDQGILITPNGPGVNPAIKKARDQGLYVIALDTPPDATFDRITALRWAIMSCAKGGTVSMPGVYGGLVDKMPIGAAFAKGLIFRMGQTHTHRYIPGLLGRIEAGQIDPSFVITHRASLDQAPELYKTFRDKQDCCIKVVLKP